MKEVKFSKAMDRLMTKGYGQFDIDLKTSDFEECMRLQKKVFKFIRKNKLQDILCTDSHREKDDTDRGFFERREELGGKDNKDCGHYRNSLRVEIEFRLGRSLKKDEVINQYLVCAKKIYTSLHKLAVRIVTEVDNRIPQFGILEMFLDPEVSDLNVLRTIGYLMSKKDKNVADFHYDRNFMTIAAYESHTGLYIQDGEKLVPYVHKEGKVLVFFSQKAEELTNGILKARVHGVSVFKKGIQRDAVVMFTHTLIPFIMKSKPVPLHLKQVA